jgi:SAM-dependent methyltransferase
MPAAVARPPRLIDHPRFLPVQASIADLPFAADSFDIVFSWGVVHHCPNPFAALDELWRVVKPGGTLAVWVYDNSPEYRRRSFLNWYLKDFDRHQMLDFADGLTKLAHLLRHTSQVALRGFMVELSFAVKGSKEQTRHILYDGLGPDYHFLIDRPAFMAWARDNGTTVSFGTYGLPLAATFTKPG